MAGNNLKFVKQYLPGLLLGASLLVGVAAGARVYTYIANSDIISERIEDTVSRLPQNKEALEKYQSNYTEMAEALNKKNIFTPPPGVKKNPVSQVNAILGNEAMIADKWYKAGDKIGEAKIVEVTSNSVVVKWNETENTFYPFEAPGAEATGPTRQAVVSEVRTKKKKRPVDPGRVDIPDDTGEQEMIMEQRRQRMMERAKKMAETRNTKKAAKKARRARRDGDGGKKRKKR